MSIRLFAFFVCILFSLLLWAAFFRYVPLDIVLAAGRYLIVLAIGWYARVFYVFRRDVIKPSYGQNG